MEEKEYEAFCEMCNTEGWKMFIEGLQGDFLHGNNLLGISSTEQFWETKGRMQLVSEILGLKDMLDRNAEQNESD